jgi:hypothetical protein
VVDGNLPALTAFQIQSVGSAIASTADITGLPGGNSELEPPDPIPNSEVKRFSADGSVGSPHVRVGHCQAFNSKPSDHYWSEGFFFARVAT